MIIVFLSTDTSLFEIGERVCDLHSPVHRSLDRVEPSFVPRMASADPLECHPPASKSAILFESILSVMRAGGMKTASVPHDWGEGPSIDPNYEEKWVNRERGLTGTAGRFF
jgi:hypothetical protein